jgi:type IV pilus assembly protein PilQ
LGSGQAVSVDTPDMSLGDFFRLIGRIANLNVVIHPAVDGKVNLMVKDAQWEPLLDLVLRNHGLGKEIEDNTMRIAPLATFEAEFKQRNAAEEARLNALPLQTQVYFLNYVKAEDIALVLSKMISPRGSVIVYPARNALIVRDVELTSEPLR